MTDCGSLVELDGTQYACHDVAAFVGVLQLSWCFQRQIQVEGNEIWSTCQEVDGVSLSLPISDRIPKSLLLDTAIMTVRLDESLLYILSIGFKFQIHRGRPAQRIFNLNSMSKSSGLLHCI